MAAKVADGRIVRIGGASGAWGDSATATPQLLEKGRVHYLVYDYLAELTMAILAGMKARRPELGYATDFVETIADNLPQIAGQGVRIVSNAGGMNPQACAAAVGDAARQQGISLRIAVVSGDDVLGLAQGMQGALRDMDTGAELPGDLISANAYLGAVPIARALDAGADVVITGRCVDSAVTLGVLMHEFGWRADDHDLLAAGSLAGHILECGCQATGGLFTDWREVPGWEDMGYPVVEARADGSFAITKPEGTGGLVTPATVAEQVLYEIGDPAAYVLPDVVCDFTHARLTQAGPDRVEVTGAKGRPATGSYKVSAIRQEGWRSVASLSIVGEEAAAKARRTAQAILARTRHMFARAGLGDYSRMHVEILGAEEPYGAQAATPGLREARLHLAVAHGDRKALEIFGREIAPAGLSWAPGTTGVGGRPSPQPDMRLHSFLLPKQLVEPKLIFEGVTTPLAVPPGSDAPVAEAAEPGGGAADAEGAAKFLPLIAIAHGRSGDKGDTANIAVIARRPEFVDVIAREVTSERVARYLAHFVKGQVRRHFVPGLGAFNFVCANALDGGVASSLRSDPWGKGLAQVLLSMPVRIPEELAALAK